MELKIGVRILSEAPMPDYKFKLYDEVEKTTGYKFPGTVIMRGVTSGGSIRYVVEHATTKGLLHICNELQLGLVAQRTEQAPPKGKDAGSTPAKTAKLGKALGLKA
jgi:hypothetical protein